MIPTKSSGGTSKENFGVPCRGQRIFYGGEVTASILPCFNIRRTPNAGPRGGLLRIDRRRLRKRHTGQFIPPKRAFFLKLHSSGNKNFVIKHNDVMKHSAFKGSYLPLDTRDQKLQHAVSMIEISPLFVCCVDNFLCLPACDSREKPLM